MRDQEIMYECEVEQRGKGQGNRETYATFHEVRVIFLCLPARSPA
jgi:hypothetical protein